ncbi:MAG: hypothetical protein IT410_02065 [Candidatus Doudnabacteria bacterium]|nr:hypothetical protein [Candidatus Doudnabacteria bacterium]
MKKSIFSQDWPFMAMGGLILAVFLSTGITAFGQTPSGEPAFKVVFGTSLSTFEGFGTIQSIDVDIDANRVDSADVAYGTGWVIDVVRTPNSYVALSNVAEVHVYKFNRFGPPIESYAVPNATSIAARGKTLLLPRYNGYVVRAVRTPQGLRTTRLNKTTEIPVSSVSVTSNDYIASYGQLDRRIVVNAIGEDGKLSKTGEFDGSTFGQVLSMSIVGDELFVLTLFPGDTMCSLQKFGRIGAGLLEPESVSSLGIPLFPQIGGGNFMSATYAADGSLGVFFLDNSDDTVAIRLFQPGIGIRKVTGDGGVRYTAIRAFPADMP